MTGGTERPAFELQERDIAVLRGLLESRILTTRHVAVLFFDSRLPAAKKRVTRLIAAGLVGSRPRRPYEPAVLCLTLSGFRLLQREGHLAELPDFGVEAFKRRAGVSPLTVRHELAVLDCKAAVVAALRLRPELQLAEFGTWPKRYAFTTISDAGSTDTTRPDGFIRVHEQRGEDLTEYAFYLEVDRSSETVDTLAAKAAAYRSHYRSGGFARWCGGSPEQYAAYPFLVLLVVQSEERRNNLCERLLRLTPPIYTQVWFATFDDVTADPLGRIWVRPTDYLAATKGTAFDPSLDRPGPYRSRPEREQWVRENVIRHALFAGENAG
ncbi:MAG TPA: replication-relaxation family protein [Tepidisphaeraceae bacterium]|nr:replication-relaxation family protein [Tepidisphaeraceae bacterium]